VTLVLEKDLLSVAQDDALERDLQAGKLLVRQRAPKQTGGAPLKVLYLFASPLNLIYERKP